MTSSSPSSGNVDVVVAAPLTASPPPHKKTEDTVVVKEVSPEKHEPVNTQAVIGGTGNFKQQSTFQGDRGGDAHDEELLALLRNVSVKSGAADRFAGGDDNDENQDQQIPEPIVVEKATKPTTSSPGPPASKATARGTSRDPNEVPPWKRGKSQQNQSSSTKEVDVDVVVATKSKQDEVPPWKQNKMGTTKPVESDVDIVVASKPLPTSHENKNADPVEQQVREEVKMGEGGGFQSNSTFQGERGGDAHDAELLALLRNVSVKSGGTDRFAAEGEHDGMDQPNLPSESLERKNEEFVDAKKKSWMPTTPWKKYKAKSDGTPPKKLASAMEVAASEVEPDQVVDDAIRMGGAGNFKKESTFQGERGGDAHDEELLALLRGVSSKSGGGDRFSDEVSRTAASSSMPQAVSKPSISQATVEVVQSVSIDPQRQHVPTDSAAPSPFPSNGDDEAIVITRDDLPAAFSDLNWKVRKEAYRVLNEAILEAADKSKPGTLDVDKVIQGFEDLISTLLAEKNATALEFAMQALTDYAESCKGAGSSDRAAVIMSALFKGNGFTSPRPSSANIASGLVMKLMEAGSSQESTAVVITSLVEKGLTSKKPKVVQLSASLILEATYSFGAASLPLAVVVSALPKVLTHSNKKIRDSGLEIVAEFCRALGSKAPMEDVISKMQKSQVKDLDALLAKQPDPTPIKIGLRCHRSSGGGSTVSETDAFAALQAGGQELEKERYAKRPAVNLMQEIKGTEFASKLKLAKWSEKVGALDIVLKCGGEQPYKLSQPSSSCDYAPLISDMKGLLTHTHFAVVSKAMEVLAMLSQGVGEKLYPNLRPLLPILLQLSKDKKLTKGVSSCLDAFFGNFLSFENVLDPDSALPDATDESKEKNALARTSAMDFLDRCITRSSSAGPRASLTSSVAKNCSLFASTKLDDSDANVRKSALKVLAVVTKSGRREGTTSCPESS